MTAGELIKVLQGAIDYNSGDLEVFIYSDYGPSSEPLGGVFVDILRRGPAMLCGVDTAETLQQGVSE